MYDAAAGKTYRLRGKEGAMDYRFFPDPDLGPLVVSRADVERLRALVPELPREVQSRLVGLGVPVHEAVHFSREPLERAYFERVLEVGAEAASTASFIANELTGLVRAASVEDSLAGALASGDTCVPDAGSLAASLQMRAAGLLTTNALKQLVGELIRVGAAGGSATPEAVVRDLGLAVVSDGDELRAVCARVVGLDANAATVARLQAGETKLAPVLFGQCLRESGGSAQPEALWAALYDVLGMEAPPAGLRQDRTKGGKKEKKRGKAR